MGTSESAWMAVTALSTSAPAIVTILAQSSRVSLVGTRGWL
jgi:hypothetical protein